MKKPTFSSCVLVALFLLLGLQSSAQNYIPFVPRYNEAIKGDMLLIGNNNLGLHKTNPYNGDTNNEHSYNRNKMVYVDIDNDGSTFNSSSADLNVPSDTQCYQVVYAALYWTAVVAGNTPKETIKFKTPESNKYIDIKGTQVYYQNSKNNQNSNAYVYYKDVTDIVSALNDADGTYTVANISSMTSAMMNGKYNQEGLSSGWSLFVIYEDPLLPSKYITSFDGFTKIDNRSPNNEQSFLVDGFKTIPVGPVRAKYAFSALEGDKNWAGDYLEINGTKIGANTVNGTSIRPKNNFFNSSVSIIDPNTNSPMSFVDRNPASKNTLGFDAGIISIPNGNNSVIGNGDTSAVIKLGTNTDIYYFYFNAFAIEIIAPKIVLTKIVIDKKGDNIGGQLVNLGDELNYVIGFQNVGNDDATNLTIRDILPKNIVFNYPQDIVSLPAGVTVKSYNQATRELIFKVDNDLVKENDVAQEIRFRVTVVKTCSLLSDACSNIVKNEALVTYQGTDNPNFIITDDPSISTNTGCLLTPSTTNFLTDITCQFEETVILCGKDVTLTAGSGYSSYSWSNSPTGSPVLGTSQTLKVKTPGVYYVHNIAEAPCQSIDQTFTVVTYGENSTNPLIPFADEVVVCPNDGKKLPNFFLCGANDIRAINTNITDTSSIIWEKLDEKSCSAVAQDNCANEDASCKWNKVGEGPNYNIGKAGQYRITLNYEGGCFSQYYFNVYSNILNPTAKAKDIICETPGEIVVGGVPSGYEYSIDGVNYQASNVFVVTEPNIYNVYVKQIDVTASPCIFSVPDVQIRKRDFKGTAVVSQPLCHDDKGNVKLGAKDARGQYAYTLSKNGTLVNSTGLVTDSNYTFSNLNAGNYTATISTEDGCSETVSFEITDPPLLTAGLALTRPLLFCDYPDSEQDDDIKEGEGDSDGTGSDSEVRGGIITVYPQGGTAPYYYFVNEATDSQSEPEIIVTAPGTYTIRIVDANNCSVEKTIIIEETPAPDFTVVSSDILCAEANGGTIKINIGNAHGNTLRFSIDGGITYVKTSTFTGLSAGNYEVMVEYGIGSATCTTAVQNVIISQTEGIDAVAELSAPYTCDSTGTIKVASVTGGTAPYSFSIDGVNFQPSDTFTNLTKGTYTITIKDANNCAFATNSIKIEALNPPTDLGFENTALTCPTNISTVTIKKTTGGDGPLLYQITAPAAAATAYQASTVFDGLAPGTYTFRVKDKNNCTYSETFSIAPLPTIKLVAQPESDITCFGAADGSARVTVSGTSTFTYSVNGGAATAGVSPFTLTGLAAGTHTVKIIDTNTKCEATASVIINAPTAALAMSTTVSPITCTQDGTVTLKATGGWGANSFVLTMPNGTALPAQTGKKFTNLTQSGTYTATVTDAKGCTVSNTFDLIIPEAIEASIDTSSNFCYDTTNGATIKVNVTKGKAPFEFQINGSAFQKGNTFTNLAPGTYTVVVKDAYGCELVMAAETIENQLEVSTILTKDLDCTATPGATITGTVKGGYAPFTQAVSFNGVAFAALGTVTDTFVYTATDAGTYQFQITDAKGCVVQSAITTVDAITPPAFNLLVQSQNILCNDDATGAINIEIDPSVGTPPFVINVKNNSTGFNYGSQTSGLAAGDYTVTVTDAKSCVATETITITQPDAINFDLEKVDITCNNPGGSSLGSITVENVMGGSGKFTYYITNNFGDVIAGNPYAATANENHTFDIINYGIYTVTVVDENGCNLSKQITIASPPSDLNITIDASVDCTTGGTAVLEAISTVGSGNYEFGILEFNTTPYTTAYFSPDAPNGSIKTFAGLTPGVVYTFVVHDLVTDCYYVKSAESEIPVASNLSTAITPNHVTCTGANNGSATFTLDNFDSTVTSVDYELFKSYSNVSLGAAVNAPVSVGTPLTVTTPSDLLPGQYYIVFTENGTGAFNGCKTASDIFEIKESAVYLSMVSSVVKNENCNEPGAISIIASNGTAPYQYQAVVAGAGVDPANWVATNTFNLSAGVYDLYVMDAYGCIVSNNATLNLDPAPVVAVALNAQCDISEGEFTIDISLPSAGIAPYSFSINGSAFQTRVAPFSVSGLNSGTHTVAVKDANGCGNTAAVTIEVPLSIGQEITALPSCAENDGSITVKGYGGTGNYSYAIIPSAPSIVLSGNVFSGVPSGNFTITITDINTGCTSESTVSLDAATQVSFTSEKTDVTCNGGSDGSITVELPISNDNPEYTFEIISGPSMVAAQASPIFTGLIAGTYTVQVNSGRGCIATEVITVNEPALLEVSGIATDFACAIDNSVNTSTLTITAVGGTPPYLYSIDGGTYFTDNTFNIIDNGSIQNISILVKDAKGCEASTSVQILPLPEMTAALVALASPIDCNGTGSVAINVTGGSGNFTYQMLPDGSTQTSNIFSLTEPGDYYFQVTDVETGCFIQTLAYTVLPFDLVEVSATAITAVTCFGNFNGAVEIDVAGYSGNYTYEVLDKDGNGVIAPTAAHTSVNPVIIDGLQGGSYTIVVTEVDSPFCSTVTNVVTVASPASPLTLSLSETSNVTCDDNSGTITAVAGGGWGSYEYELTGASTVAYSSNATFDNLSAGVYTVNVKDAGGCVASQTITLALPDAITAVFTPSATLLACDGDKNATITISNVVGGQNGNYTYTLHTVLPAESVSGPQSSPVFSGLGAGTYYVTITDGYNCSVTSATIEIKQPLPLEADLVAVNAATCLTNATLTLSATGGTGLYTYSATQSFGTVLGTFSSSTTISVSAGTYKYYVKDANGCVSTVSNEVKINEVPDLILNLTLDNAVINCHGDNTGVIIASAQGGLGNYVYTLFDGANNPIAGATQASPGVFTGLSAGTYSVKVVSGDCDQTSAKIDIVEPLAALTATATVTNVSCQGSNNGAIEITATGGTGLIKYAISPKSNQFFESNVFDNLAPGTYDVVVQDERGCYVVLNVTVTEPLPVVLTIVANSIVPEICFGDVDGAFSVTIGGGTGPYSVSLDNIDGPYATGAAGQTQFDFTALKGGDHTVFVRDSQGCESEWHISFPESVNIVPQLEIEYLCDNNTSGNRVTVLVDESVNNLADLDYSLNGGSFQASNIFENVTPGIGHFIDVRHSNGCIKRSALFDIDQMDPVTLVLTDGDMNQIIGNAAGGNGDYQFTINGEDHGSDNLFIIRESGNYTITVTDGFGCSATATRYFEFIDLCIPNYFVPEKEGWAPGCGNNYPNLEFKIFDRYGREVGTYRQGQKWDGKYKGRALPTGDYWYIVKLHDNMDDRDFVGHFTLYR